jgi:hypothetical protein
LLFLITLSPPGEFSLQLELTRSGFCFATVDNVGEQNSLCVTADEDLLGVVGVSMRFSPTLLDLGDEEHSEDLDLTETFLLWIKKSSLCMISSGPVKYSYTESSLPDQAREHFFFEVLPGGEEPGEISATTDILTFLDVGMVLSNQIGWFYSQADSLNCVPQYLFTALHLVGLNNMVDKILSFLDSKEWSHDDGKITICFCPLFTQIKAVDGSAPNYQAKGARYKVDLNRPVIPITIITVQHLAPSYSPSLRA